MDFPGQIKINHGTTPAAAAREEIFGMNSELWLRFPSIPSSSQRDGSGIAGDGRVWKGFLESSLPKFLWIWLSAPAREPRNPSAKCPWKKTEPEELREEKFGYSVGVGD